MLVSVPPLAWFVERLAGGRVRTALMVPPGANPDTYQPTLDQLGALERAALYVKLGQPGFPFEDAWLGHLLAEHGELAVADASARLPRPSGDPHVWLSPRHARAMAEELGARLAALLPDGAPALRAARDALLAEIDALDRELEAELAPVRGRTFVVFHPAWGHFAARYGLRQLAIQHEGKEPDPRALAELVAAARAAGVRVVFVQPQFDRLPAETLARELGARVQVLDPLASDWAENLRRAARAIAEAVAP